MTSFILVKVFSVSKAEHASSTPPTLRLHVMEEEGGGANRLPVYVAKQAVKFTQCLYVAEGCPIHSAKQDEDCHEGRDY